MQVCLEIEEIIEKAFHEDAVFDDITTQCCISGKETVSATLLLKQDAIVAGLAYIPSIFQFYDEKISTELLVEEGSFAKNGTLLANITGPAAAILSTERVALNLLQHLCGIATLTRKFVEQVKDLPAEILDTRKTLPGLRSLQKYASSVGGATNHRFSLSDQILIKNNHLALIANASPITYAVQKAKEQFPEKRVEIEVHSLSDLDEALASGVDAILLDNMDVKSIAEAVKKTRGSIYLEASGGIQLENVRAYAETGVDGISIGALTHSANAVDISLRMI